MSSCALLYLHPQYVYTNIYIYTSVPTVEVVLLVIVIFLTKQCHIFNQNTVKSYFLQIINSMSVLCRNVQYIYIYIIHFSSRHIPHAQSNLHTFFLILSLACPFSSPFLPLTFNLKLCCSSSPHDYSNEHCIPQPTDLWCH